MRHKYFAESPKSQSGFTLIELLVVVSIIALLIMILIPAIHAVSVSSRTAQCSNNLRQIGIAFQSYLALHDTFPFGVGPDDGAATTIFGSTKYRRYSAQSQILPMLERTEVYNAINFQVSPFDPYIDASLGANGEFGTNYTAAHTTIAIFICPEDLDLLDSPWGTNNYRTCNGTTWAGRRGNGLFGQESRVRASDVLDGLSNTAAMSERIRGTGDAARPDLLSDLFDRPGEWTESGFRDWCAGMTMAEGATLYRDVNGGKTWIEGNMMWTRYNHVLPPGRASCKNGATWNGVVMTAASYHPGGVNLLMGDGSLRFVRNEVSTSIWWALGTINGAEVASDQ